jgi:hypothetical protein
MWRSSTWLNEMSPCIEVFGQSPWFSEFGSDVGTELEKVLIANQISLAVVIIIGVQSF